VGAQMVVFKVVEELFGLFFEQKVVVASIKLLLNAENVY
jgi:hypothetical protein